MLPSYRTILVYVVNISCGRWSSNSIASSLDKTIRLQLVNPAYRSKRQSAASGKHNIYQIAA